MQILLCKSKITGGTVTNKNIYYEGSVTLDKKFIEKADLIPGEMVYLLNINNGARIMTYVIEGTSDSGIICVNGAAARFFEIGDPVIILSFSFMEKSEAINYKTKILRLSKNNKIIE